MNKTPDFMIAEGPSSRPSSSSFLSVCAPAPARPHLNAVQNANGRTT